MYETLMELYEYCFVGYHDFDGSGSRENHSTKEKFENV
eukprot:CAMPEP_0201488432 /NCGR_PEP_ID=MMETSP0151_2-20130828/18191_1 /ASSEMBLY_ACC=CAM_ASM_000257 /TAXON_ID=200890 /ORGANISM="Paramoeba atlantica, Strain 621/1 / CCAP 1560/9" /LENGTH=37 /DNA_ID= /DNA_START= /DNA_END= /DNA_ORIENTATION=